MSEYEINWEYGDHPVARSCTLPNGVRAEIRYDEFAESPRDGDRMNLCTMFAYHRDYDLGDERLPADGLPEIECPRCDGEGYLDMGTDDEDSCPRCFGMGRTEPTVDEWLRSVNAVAAQALFLYEHSGITISSGRTIMMNESVTPEDTRSSGRFGMDGAGWDTSFVGFIVATEEGITECCGDDPKYRTEEFLTEAMDGEIKEYASYLEGDAYYIDIELPDHNLGTDMWCVGGFIGYEYAEEEATAMLEEAAEEYDERKGTEERESAEWAARDVETV